jgi:hypothetical protein
LPETVAAGKTFQAYYGKELVMTVWWIVLLKPLAAKAVDCRFQDVT